MLSRADGVNPVGRTEAATRVDGVAHARQEQFQRSLSALVGKSMLAEVMGRHTDGSYLVKLGNAAARMLLPGNLQPGTQIPMTLLASEPRPTFSLGTSSNLPDASDATPLLVFADGADDLATLAANAARAAALAGKAAQFGGAMPEGEAAGTALLSDAAKTISSVLGAAMKNPDASSAILGTKPLAGAPGASPEQLAGALRDALGRSGLFYESHLAEWAGGKRTLAELAREPQMLRAADDGPGARPSLTDPATAQLINLQLSAHEQSRIAWQGQAWPGQQMEWEVERDAPEGRPGAEEAEPGWRSRLRLRFPLLGDIDARLVLNGGQVHIALRPSDGEAGELLRRHAGRLGSALEAAGITLSALEVRDQEQRDE